VTPRWRALLGSGVFLVFVAFVRLYEEPTLRAEYGAEYERYRAAVPGWIPRLRRQSSRNPTQSAGSGTNGREDQ
jgi:protein-S-isoprenylcysteine O-methyltransferase Ste14